MFEAIAIQLQRNYTTEKSANTIWWWNDDEQFADEIMDNYDSSSMTQQIFRSSKHQQQ